MYYTLSADLLSGYNAFDRSMVLENHRVIAARLNGTNSQQQHTTAGSNNSNNGNTAQRARIMGHQGPVIDLLVTMIAVPILILCALQLEKNLHDMTNSPESRWLVFALGVGMLIVSVIICGYVTHRMGVCIWAGPIDEAGNRIGGRSGNNSASHINSQNDILRIVDALPPSYDSVVKFDIPPPPYDCVVIDMKEEDDNDDNNTSGSSNNNNNNTTTNRHDDDAATAAAVAAAAATAVARGALERTPMQAVTQQQRQQCKEPQLPDGMATMHI